VIHRTRISAAGAERLVRTGRRILLVLEESQVTDAMREIKKRGLIDFHITAPPKKLPES
jgi:hypothetical protein